jgi:hypothetical protein
MTKPKEPKLTSEQIPVRRKSELMKMQKRAITNQASKTFKSLKSMNVAQYLILSGKISGKSDAEIARQLDCHECTVKRERQKLQSSEWMTTIMLNVLDLAPLFVESLRTLALKGDAFTTVSYFKGMGLFKDKHEITHKADPATQQKKFADRLDKTLGVKAKEQLQGIGVDVDKPPVEDRE